ncbi:MAG: cytochrome c [Vicinamibacterales bacterium]
MRLVAAATVVVIGVARGQAQGPERTVWDGVFTDAQAARGATLYTENCALCHGPTLAGADGPPLTGVEFTSNWNSLTLGDLADRIRTAMPPDNPGKLSAQERADVIAHILNVAQFPAGVSELPRDTSALARIRVRASRP